MSIHFKAPEEIPEAHRPQVEDALKYTTDELCKLLIAAGIPTHQLNDALREARMGKKHLVRDGKAQHPIPLSVKLKIDVPRAKLSPKPDESKQPDRSGEGISYNFREAREKAYREMLENNREVKRQQDALNEALKDFEIARPPRERAIRAGAKALGLSVKETEQLVRALTVSRTRAEAIGEIAGQQAIADEGHKRHLDFIVRFHGPDDMTVEPLREWEFKGTRDGSTAVARDSKDRNQGSAEKNLAYAIKMLNKSRKIGLTSSRQGGPYTEGEIHKLWKEVFGEEGEKEHYSVHANTETGEYVVCERDMKGKIKTTSSLMRINNFEAKKSIIEALIIP